MRALGALLVLLPALARGDPLLTRDVVSAAAVDCSTGVYQLQASLGEPVSGRVAADSTTLHLGFWSPWRGGTTPVAPPSSEPSRFWLGQNAPNPFNPRTSIQYSVPGAGPPRGLRRERPPRPDARPGAAGAWSPYRHLGRSGPGGTRGRKRRLHPPPRGR